MSDISSRIKIVRESLGKSQKEMAKTIGISLPALQGYEAGKSFPGGKVIEVLVKLGIDANWILSGEGQMGRQSINQSISGNSNLQIGGSVRGNASPKVTNEHSSEFNEVIDLLEKYGNSRIVEGLKEKLLKIKAIMEDD